LTATEAHQTQTILFVEDDDRLREATALTLERDGFTVIAEADGRAGLAAFEEAPPALALLDIMLPHLDGVALCHAIRAHSDVPIVMLSARGDAVDIVRGLEAGADDYVTKPFDGHVLTARLRAVLRRSERTRDDATLRIAGLEIDERGMTVSVGGAPIPLTSTEFRLLSDLAHHAGVVRTRPQLLEEVWEYAWAGDTRLVDVHVQRLRAKLGSGVIETVRGVGYKLPRA
jgi:DNA-binding response OmpR family regulator